MAARGGAAAKLHEELKDEEALPDTVERHCTDVPCLAVFLLGNALLAWAVYEVAIHGQPERNISLTEEGYDSDPCGYRSNWADPFLFFCLNHTNTTPADAPLILNTDHTVCVSECPLSPNDHPCKEGHQSHYPAAEFMGIICLPDDASLRLQLRNYFKEHNGAKTVVRLHSLQNAWLPLFGMGFLAILAFLLYIVFLSKCAGCLVWTMFSLLTIVPLATGAWYLHCWKTGSDSDILGLPEGSPHFDLILGLVLVMVGGTFLCSACYRGDSIELAVDCLEAACDCIVQTGSLRMVPIIALLCRGALVVVCGAALLLLISACKTGEEGHGLVLVQGAEALLGSHPYVSPEQLVHLAVIVVMFFWDLQFVTAFTDFVSMYLTQLWFFHRHKGDGDMPHCALCKAYWAACRYHLGTLSLGGLVLGLTAPFRIVLGFIANQSRTAHNPVTILLGAVCCLCVSCFESCLAPLSKEAFMDLCLSSRPFLQGAERALVLTRSEEEAVKMLTGVTSIFQIGGLFSICFLAHALTLVVVTSYHNYASIKSPHYVYGKELVAAAGAVFASLGTLPFMMIFDTVSDTIIFCYSVQKYRSRSQLPAGPASRYCGCLGTSLHCMTPMYGHSTDELVALKGHDAHREPGNGLPKETAAPPASQTQVAWQTQAAWQTIPASQPVYHTRLVQRS